MDALVGVGATRELRVENRGAVPVTTDTVTYTLVGPTGTTILAAVPATNNGDGWYSVALTGVQIGEIGTYTERWTSTTLGVYYDSFQADYPSGQIMQVWELRHLIADLCGDLWTGSVLSATPTSLRDLNRVESDNQWRGKPVYIYAGTGRGQERNVSTSVQSTATLTIPAGWSQTPDNSSLYELHRNWSVATYLRMMNAALATIQNFALVHAVDETLTITDDTVHEYTVPPKYRYIGEVWQRDTTTDSADWECLDPRDWATIPGRRILRLTAPREGLALRLVGQRVPDPIVRDTAFVDAPIYYLMYETASLLHTTKILGPALDTDGMAQKASMFQQLAEKHRPNAKPLIGARRL